MPRITKTETQTETSPSKPSNDSLRNEMVDILQHSRFPSDGKFVQWFLAECCSPPNRFGVENIHQVKVHGKDGYRWSWPYRDRILDCLHKYVALSSADREMLHAGVDDGVRWRGEAMRVYIDIANEAMKMREMGVDAYRAQMPELR